VVHGGRAGPGTGTVHELTTVGPMGRTWSAGIHAVASLVRPGPAQMDGAYGNARPARRLGTDT